LSAHRQKGLFPTDVVHTVLGIVGNGLFEFWCIECDDLFTGFRANGIASHSVLYRQLTCRQFPLHPERGASFDEFTIVAAHSKRRKKGVSPGPVFVFYI